MSEHNGPWRRKSNENLVYRLVYRNVTQPGLMEVGQINGGASLIEALLADCELLVPRSEALPLI